MADIQLDWLINEGDAISAIQGIENSLLGVAKASGDVNKDLSDTFKSSANAIGDMEKATKDATKQIMRNEQEVEKLDKTNRSFGNRLRGIIGDYKVFGVSLNGIIGNLQNKQKALTGTVGGLNIATKSLKTFTIALAATGIGAIVIALGAFVAALSRTQGGLDKISKVTTGFSTIIDILNQRIGAIGTALSNVFNQSFTDTISQIGQAFTGITEEIVREVSAAVELEEASQRLRDNQRELNVEYARTRAQIEQLRNLGRDETKSVEERQAAITKALKLESELEQQRISLAEENLRIIREQNALNESFTADLDAEAQAEIELERIKSESARRQRTDLQQINILKKQELDRTRQQAQAEQDRIQELNDNFNELLGSLNNRSEQANLQSLTGIDRLTGDRDIAIKEIEKFALEITEAAQAAGKELPESFNDDIQALFDNVNREFDKGREELNEKQIQDSLQSIDLQRSIAEQEVQLRTFFGNDVITAEEQKQQKILELQIASAKDQLEILKQSTSEQSDEQRAQIELQLQTLEKSLADLNAATLRGAIDRREQLALQEIELIQESSSVAIPLEEEKERKKLEAQIRFSQQRLALLRNEKGEESFEVQSAINQIELLQQRLEAIKVPDSPFESLKRKLLEAFQITDAEFEAVTSQLGNLFSSLQTRLSANLEAQISQQDALIDKLNERIGETESALDRELALKEAGFANDFALEKQNLEELQAQRDEAETKRQEAQAKANKLQLAQESISQTSSLITAAANLTKGFTAFNPIIGIALAAAAIGAMFQIFARAKANAAEATKFFKGGHLPDHLSSDEGKGEGLRIERTNIRVGGGEFIMNRKSTKKNLEFIEMLNSGMYDGVNLAKVVPMYLDAPPVAHMPIAHARVKSANAISRQPANDQNSNKGEELKVLKEGFKQMVQKVDRLTKIIEAKPDYVPISKEGYLKVTQKGTTTTKEICKGKVG